MQSVYHIPIERLRQEGLKELFDALERAFRKYQVDFYVVGAFARDIWLTIHSLPEKRATKDIDLAILISTEKQFLELKEYLIEKENFSDLQNNKFTLFYKNKFQVDLLPFGDIENMDRTVTFPGLGLTTISTLGLDEVYKNSVEVNIGLREAFKVSSIPGIVILKFLAWEDRPEVRPKDALDIMYIIENYFNITSEDIYNNHLDLFDAESEILDISSRVLGRHMGLIFINATRLQLRLIELLKSQTQNIDKSPLAEAMIKDSAFTVRAAMSLLELILTGILDIVEFQKE